MIFFTNFSKLCDNFTAKISGMTRYVAEFSDISRHRLPAEPCLNV